MQTAPSTATERSRLQHTTPLGCAAALQVQSGREARERAGGILVAPFGTKITAPAPWEAALAELICREILQRKPSRAEALGMSSFRRRGNRIVERRVLVDKRGNRLARVDLNIMAVLQQT